mgnify:CR=1 FL=1
MTVGKVSRKLAVWSTIVGGVEEIESFLALV